MNGAIVGLGTDIVNVPRVARLARLHGNRFLNKFLHPEELKQYQVLKIQQRKDTFLASRWAAKEAAYKAFTRHRIPFPDFKIANDSKGRPELKLEGMALDLAKEMKIGETFLSISHDTDYATATVILTTQPPQL